MEAQGLEQGQVFNPLFDIHQYNTALTISQLMKFCEKKGMPTTRAMVQNYIRLGLLPPPVSKRLYTHNHIAALVIIENLKTVYDAEQIKSIMKPFMAPDGLPLEAYAEMIRQREAAIREWYEKVKPLLKSELAAAAFAGDVKASLRIQV